MRHFQRYLLHNNHMHEIDLNKKNNKWNKDLLQGKPKKKQKEVGGPQGPEPTRYGDWEKKGRCIDF